jgi:hypothetical protein
MYTICTIAKVLCAPDMFPFTNRRILQVNVAKIEAEIRPCVKLMKPFDVQNMRCANETIH